MKLNIDKFGRILIPKPLRERLGLSAGTELEVDIQDQTLQLEPAHPEPELEEEDGLLIFTGTPQETLEDAVTENRKQRDHDLTDL